MKPHCLILAAALAGCSDPRPAPSTTEGLAGQLDCFRETGATMISAHRGGPAEGRSENSVGGIRALGAAGVLYAEVDVRRSDDGVYYLLHDETLDRTTSGTGPVAGLTWSELNRHELLDPAGEPTGEHIPSLANALDAARAAGVVLNLDLKDISPADIVEQIHAMGAQRDVIIIAYTVEAAAQLHAIDDGLVLSAPDDPDALDRAGVNLDHVYLWTGTSRPDAGVDARFAEAGLETSAGLFPFEPGPPALYSGSAAAGVEILGVDDVAAAVDALGGADALRARIAACPR